MNSSSSRWSALSMHALVDVAALAVLAVALTTTVGGTFVPTPAASLDALAHQTAAVAAAVAANLNVLPSKYAVSSVPPAKLQLARGTCWDFATIAVVEHLYRQQGIAKGFLAPNEYVRFSEQTYGTLVIDYCNRNPTLCMSFGDGTAQNTTEGGETDSLYTFADDFARTLLPDAVCPYVTKSGPGELVCPGLQAALATNPIKAKMNHMTPLYDINDVKKHLLTSGASLTISTPVTVSSSYLPCDDPAADWDVADCLSACQACPLGYGTRCCHAYSHEWWNMNAEIGWRHELQAEAGHAVMLVGFNDNYRTEEGAVGGFIFRNSWKDGVYSWEDQEFNSQNYNTRASHSIGYFMQTISESDEKVLCPNSRYPRNWATGVSVQFDSARPAYSQVDLAAADDELMPLFLLCSPNNTDSAICTNTSVYVSQGYEFYHDGLFLFTFAVLPLPTAPNTFPLGVEGHNVVVGPRTMEQVAQAFTVMETATHKQRHNAKDFCGFYFLPYDYVRKVQSELKDGSFLAYGLEFDPQSYAANKHKYPKLDYHFIEASTYTQTPVPEFVDVFPNTMHGFPFFPQLPQNPSDHTDLQSRAAAAASNAHSPARLQQKQQQLMHAHRAHRAAAVAAFDAGRAQKAFPKGVVHRPVRGHKRLRAQQRVPKK